MAANQTLEVDLIDGSLALRYTDDQNGTQMWEYYPACSILGIIGLPEIGLGTRDAVTNQRKVPTRFTDSLKVIIHLDGPKNLLSFDIQQVTNQPTWLPTIVGLAVAIDDIKTWADCSGGTVAGIGALNATATSILNALVATQDMEILMVRDTGNADQVVQQIAEYDETTSTWSYTYKDVDGVAYIPVGPLIYLDPAAVLNLILTQETITATALTDLSKVEDTAHVSGDRGIMSLAVRNDTLTTLTSTNGDYSPLAVDGFGQVLVKDIIAETQLLQLDVPLSDVASEVTLASIDAKLNSLGQKASVGSVPVVLSTEQQLILDSINSAIDLPLSFLAREATLDALSHAEDEAHVSGNQGVMSLSVRNDSAVTSLSDADGDYTPQSSDEFGQQFVVDNKLESGAATLTAVTSNSTAYGTASSAVDMRAFQRISLFPDVTTNAGTRAYYKVEWSFDNTNWFDETVDSVGTTGTPAANEVLITQDIMVRQFPSAATGLKTLSAVTLDKKARYLRISQKSDAAVTVITTYRYQLLKV